MTAAQNPAPKGPDTAIVRSRQHVEAVRADANRAAEENAAEFGERPDYLISHAIDWALGQRTETPFTSQATPNRAAPGDVAAEVATCRHYLETTPYSDEAEETIDRARDVLKVLDWLTGADDLPPTYGEETEPGDLVGGRGRIVRSDAEIRRMISMAREKLAAGMTSHGLGPDWHDGVIATLEWVNGDRAESPVRGKVLGEPPDGPQITIEQGEAEELITPPQLPTDIPFHFADAVASTCRWLLGGTTQPPVTEND